ncbi:hypothetical protein [Solibacillus sp. CAU 1738]|uniref:hypothetical protein n=1 Tax=Solibacillus sp. CAU 1738 TaxID=3140363 RepID=UPI0032607DA7
MLATPLGNIKLFVNDNEITFTAIRLGNLERICPDVNGRYLIQYNYKKKFKHQKIKCCLPFIDVKGEIGSGERLEAIAFYKDGVKLTIGVEAEFDDQLSGYDYSGDYLNNGITYETFETTEDKILQFGVCWIEPRTEENDHQTWFGADPSIM